MSRGGVRSGRRADRHRQREVPIIASRNQRICRSIRHNKAYRARPRPTSLALAPGLELVPVAGVRAGRVDRLRGWRRSARRPHSSASSAARCAGSSAGQARDRRVRGRHRLAVDGLDLVVFGHPGRHFEGSSPAHFAPVRPSKRPSADELGAGGGRPLAALAVHLETEPAAGASCSSCSTAALRDAELGVGRWTVDSPPPTQAARATPVAKNTWDAGA